MRTEARAGVRSCGAYCNAGMKAKWERRDKEDERGTAKLGWIEGVLPSMYIYMIQLFSVRGREGNRAGKEVKIVNAR